MWLALGQRGAVYLILIFLLYVCIFLQLFQQGKNTAVILVEIITTTAFLILPQLFVAGIYFGDTDHTVHVNYASMIVNYGGLPADIFGEYQFFCLYHIFGALTSIFVTIGVNHALSLISSAAVLSSIVIVYLIARYFTKSEYISLFAAGFYAVMPMILSALQIPAPRILASMAFFILVYLLFAAKKKTAIPFIILAVIVATYMTGVHHAQLPLCLFVLFFLCLGSIIYFRKLTIGNTVILGITVILPIVYLLYMYLNPLINVIEDRLFGQIESGAMATSVISQAEVFTIDIYTQLYYASSAALVLFIIVGLYLIGRDVSRTKKILILLPFILLLFIFFVPRVIDIFPSITEALQLYRFRVVFSSLFSIAMGLGVTALINLALKSKQKMLNLSLIFIVCLLFVFSSAIVVHSADNEVHQQLDFLKPSEKYLPVMESAMIYSLQDFIENGGTLYADHRDIRYFLRTADVGAYSLHYYKYGKTLYTAFSDMEADVSSYKYILFPLERYERVGVKLYESRNKFTGSNFVDPSEDSGALMVFYENVYLHALVYDNSGNKIYYHS